MVGKSARIIFAIVVTFLFVSNEGQARFGWSNYPRSFKYTVRVGGGYGLFRMKSINEDYIENFAREFDIFENTIDSGPHLFGEIGMFVSLNTSVNFAVEYLKAVTEHESVISDLFDTYTRKGRMEVSMMALRLRFKHYLLAEPVGLFISGGASRISGDCNSKFETTDPRAISPESYSFSAVGVGLASSVGVSFKIQPRFILDFEAGYRYYSSGDLEDNDGQVWQVEYGGQFPMNLDFTGPFLSADIALVL
jgi:hypothetical protein